MKQLITWTVLPNGIAPAAGGSGAMLKLSIRASVRLTPDNEGDPVGTFTDFINWPLKPWSFAVHFGSAPAGATSFTATLSGLKPLSKPDSDLWQKLFQGKKKVVVRERKTGDYSNPLVRSFPAVRIHEFIKQQYTAVAIESPTELPSPAQVWGRRNTVTEGYGRRPSVVNFSKIELGDRSELKSMVDSCISNGVIRYPSGTADDKALMLDFFQAEYFHAFKGGDYKTPPVKPDLEFHQIIALLGDYPELLRALGLVFDLEVPIPASGMGSIDEPIIRVWPENHLADGMESKVALATRYDYDAASGIFRAKSSSGKIVSQHLDMSGKEFSVAQVDIDGAAIKAINFTQTVGDLGIHKPPVLGTPKTAALPALRSGGMSVFMSERAAGFIQTIKNGTGFETQLANPATRSDIKFSAEDIARGYRLDIYDEEKKSWFSLCRRKGNYTHEGDPKGTFLLPEELHDEGTLTAGATSSSAPGGSTDLYLHEALFHWDGWSLVVAHPGKTIRKPVAGSPDNNVGYEPSDIANAIGLEATFKVPSGTLPRLRFGRRYRLRARIVDIAGNSRTFESDFDATGATSAAPYLRFEPVASPAMMSDPNLRPGESVDRLVIRSWEGDATSPTAETTRRHILPPRTAVQMAELHGMIDTPAPDGAASWYSELAKRDAATISEYLAPGDTLEEAPYLPDPLAGGATFMGLPGEDAPLAFPVDFSIGKAWPHAGTFRIQLKEGPAGFEWKAAERTLEVCLPKAERITLRMSSSLSGSEALETLGIWSWISEATPASWLEKFRNIAIEGRHWMLTPFREITLIHAVQKPLEAPRLQGAAPSRKPGETFCTLTGLLHLHGRSTDKVDFRATWNVIRPAADTVEGYTVEPHSADACHFKVNDPELLYAPLAERHELGDTRHHRISYWATAASRFREYFEDELDPALPAGLEFTTPDSTPRPPDFILDVPSSVRPLAPTIEYIIPTFNWDEEQTDEGTFRRRGGNSLRVYMSGEWFSSGEGELLGVVLAHGPQIVTADGINPGEAKALISPAAPAIPEKLKPLVTRWGIDPIWLSGLVYPTPTLHHFPDAKARATDLVLEENPTVPAIEPHWGVAVAGHAVAYDSERKLWYADITIEAGPSYYPFVRLALARYQPCSVAGTELSRVFTADCVQTTPDRLLWVDGDPVKPFTLRVSLSGIAPRGCYNVVCPNRVIVRAEVCMPDSEPPVWVPLNSPWTPLDEMQVSKTVTVWSGHVTLPQIRDAQRYRLVVEEYEFLNADPGRGLDTTAATQLRSISRVSKTAAWPRLVYSDTIELQRPMET